MGNYRDTLEKEVEAGFIRNAMTAIRDGQSWETFSAKNGQYTLMNPVKWRMEYEAMTERKKATPAEEWTLRSELTLANNKRITKAMASYEDDFYTENRTDLLALAADHCGWSEAKRRMKWTDDHEKYFRRAQAEAGVRQSSERPDPIDEAFQLGFFS